MLQACNVAHLPGIVGASLAMPDMHEGYGFPIGGVAAFDAEDGVVSPGGVGYDINCGVRLMRTDVRAAELGDRLRATRAPDPARRPRGRRQRGRDRRRSPTRDLDDVLRDGARRGPSSTATASAEDLELHRGERVPAPAPTRRALSRRARERGAPQLGTLGSGNHFAEVQVVDEVFDERGGRRVRPRARAPSR